MMLPLFVFAPGKNMLISEGMCHLFGLIFLILLTVWCVKHFDGFSIGDDADKMINTHMLFMSIGMIYLTGISMTLYRLLKGSITQRVQYIHMIFSIIALIFSIAGCIIVYNAHSRAFDIAHFHSLHSWIGVVVIVLTIAQHIAGIVFFTCLPPARNLEQRDEYGTLHAFIGLFTFLAACITSNIGLMEKVHSSVLTYASLDQSTLFANFSGLFMSFFAATVFYICVNPYFEWDRISIQTYLSNTNEEK